MKRVEFFISIVMVMVLLPVWSVAFAEKEGTMSDALSVIHNRKSVRSFTGQNVNKDALDKIIRAGMTAPTAVNMQPWASRKTSFR